MNENTKLWNAMLLPGFGCWSQDQTTARLGNTTKAGTNKEGNHFTKIDYIHYNPTAENWRLCNDPIDYYYSSANFMEVALMTLDF